MKKRDSEEKHLQWVKITGSFLVLLTAGMMLYHTIREEKGLWKNQDSPCRVEIGEEDHIQREETEEILFYQELMEIWSAGRGLEPSPFLWVLSIYLGNLWRLWETYKGLIVLLL